MGNRIYGCDDCLAVCPWNKFAQQGREAKLAARDVARAPALAELAQLDDAAFRAMFAKTAVKRTGRDRFIRNVLIAIGNSGDRIARAAGRAAPGRRIAAGSRRRGVGARPARSARGSRRLRRRMPARPMPPSPRNGPPRGRVIPAPAVIGLRYKKRQGGTSWPHSRAAPCLPDCAAAAALRPERAFAAWPERNISLIHGLTAGGGVDVSARVIAEGLSRKLGQQIVVEPKPGAAGTLAAAQMARATPDGYHARHGFRAATPSPPRPTSRCRTIRSTTSRSSARRSNSRS